MKLRTRLSALLAGAAMSMATAGMADDLTIGYITKSATNVGWMMINQGASDAAEAEGVNLVTVGPAFADDLTSQIEVFENLIAQGVDAIAVAPADSSGIAPVVEDAMEAGIPVIAVDTGVSGAEVVSFVATDNLAVAKVQGAVAATLVEDGAPVIYVTGDPAQSTGQDRRDGFMEAFASHRPNSEILVVPTAWDASEAQEGVETLLNARSDVAMIVHAWDGATMASKAAMENLGLSAGDIKLVGFDGASDAIEAMEDGWVHANTAQMLYGMGFDGITIAARAARGEDVPARVDTGFFLVTPMTMDSYKALIGLE